MGHITRHPSERMHGRVKIQIFGHTFPMESLAPMREEEVLLRNWFIFGLFIFFWLATPAKGFFSSPISVVDGRKGPSFHTGITLASPPPPPLHPSLLASRLPPAFKYSASRLHYGEEREGSKASQPLATIFIIHGSNRRRSPHST